MMFLVPALFFFRQFSPSCSLLFCQSPGSMPKMLNVLGKVPFSGFYFHGLYGNHEDRLENILILYFSGKLQCKGLRIEGGSQARVWLGSKGIRAFLSASVPEGRDVMINMI